MKQKKKPLNNSKVWSDTADNLTTPWWGTVCGGREHTASSLGPTHLLEVQSEEAFIKSHVVISPTLLFVIHFSSPKNQVAVSSENACLWLSLPVWNFTLWWSCSSEVSNAIRHVCPFLFSKMLWSKHVVRTTLYLRDIQQSIQNKAVFLLLLLIVCTLMCSLTELFT